MSIYYPLPLEDSAALGAAHRAIERKRKYARVCVLLCVFVCARAQRLINGYSTIVGHTGH